MYSTNTSTHPSASLGVPAGQYAARGALGHLPHYACVRASCAWARIEPTTACPPSILPVIWELLLDGLHPPPRSHYPAVSGRVGGRSNVWIPWQNTLFPDSLEFLLSQQTAAGVVAEEEQSDAIYAYVRARIEWLLDHIASVVAERAREDNYWAQQAPGGADIWQMESHAVSPARDVFIRPLIRVPPGQSSLAFSMFSDVVPDGSLATGWSRRGNQPAGSDCLSSAQQVCTPWPSSWQFECMVYDARLVEAHGAARKTAISEGRAAVAAARKVARATTLAVHRDAATAETAAQRAGLLSLMRAADATEAHASLQDGDGLNHERAQRRVDASVRRYDVAAAAAETAAATALSARAAADGADGVRQPIAAAHAAAHAARAVSDVAAAAATAADASGPRPAARSASRAQARAAHHLRLADAHVSLCAAYDALTLAVTRSVGFTDGRRGLKVVDPADTRAVEAARLAAMRQRLAVLLRGSNGGGKRTLDAHVFVDWACSGWEHTRSVFPYDGDGDGFDDAAAGDEQVEVLVGANRHKALLAGDGQRYKRGLPKSDRTIGCRYLFQYSELGKGMQGRFVDPLGQ